MKKPFSFLFALFLFFTFLLSHCFGESEESILYLDIFFSDNVISKGNIELFIDNEYIAKISEGEYFTKKLKLENDKHDIIFYKENDHSIYASKTLAFSADMTFQCSISISKSKINIKDYKYSNGLIGASLNPPSVQQMRLKDAIKKLSEIGFVNIECFDESGNEIKSSNAYVVVSQNHTFPESIDKNDKLFLTCVDIDEYFQELLSGLSVDKAIEKVNGNYYSLTYANAAIYGNSVGYLSSTSAANRSLWRIKSVILSNGNSTIKLTVEYTGKVEIPDVKDRLLSEAHELFGSHDCSNLIIESIDGSPIGLDKNWVVLNQSVEAGKFISANEEIIISCRKLTKEEKDNGKFKVITPSTKKVLIQESSEYETIKYSYDLNGNLASVNKAGDEVYSKVSIRYSYNGQNQLTEEKEELFHGSRDTKYEYGANGLLIKEVLDQRDRSRSIEKTITYSYDENGNLISKNSSSDRSSYAGSGGKHDSSTQVYEYDSNNNLISDTTIGGYKYLYEYDRNNMLIKKSVYEYYKDISPKEVITYEYDEDSNLIKEASSKNGITVYTYNDQKTTSVTYDHDGKLKYTYEYTYDKDGDILKEKHIESGSIQSYIYDYIEISN